MTDQLEVILSHILPWRLVGIVLLPLRLYGWWGYGFDAIWGDDGEYLGAELWPWRSQLDLAFLMWRARYWWRMEK